MAEPRTPKLVIDQAIRDNRVAERLCYLFAIAFVAAGLFTLVWGAITGEERWLQQSEPLQRCCFTLLLRVLARFGKTIWRFVFWK